MEVIAVVAVVGLVLALCVGNVVANTQLRAVLEASKDHDEYMKRVVDQYGRGTKEIIDATGTALAKNLVGYGVSAPGSIPQGMDTLGLTEETGQQGAAFPNVEYDPWQVMEQEMDMQNIITEPSEVPVNGSEPD